MEHHLTVTVLEHKVFGMYAPMCVHTETHTHTHTQSMNISHIIQVETTLINQPDSIAVLTLKINISYISRHKHNSNI